MIYLLSNIIKFKTSKKKRNYFMQTQSWYPYRQSKQVKRRVSKNTDKTFVYEVKKQINIRHLLKTCKFLLFCAKSGIWRLLSKFSISLYVLLAFVFVALSCYSVVLCILNIGYYCCFFHIFKYTFNSVCVLNYYMFC